VLDAVDALSASTHYDEFVILSADADFTPLALRCRAADRRVTIITASPAASAYRAVADTVVTADELAELVKDPDRDLDEPTVAHRSGEHGRGASTSTGSTAGPKAVAVNTSISSAGLQARRSVLRRVRSADRPLTGDVVAQSAVRADPSLTTSDWDGAGDFFTWLARTLPDLGASARPTPGYV